MGVFNDKCRQCRDRCVRPTLNPTDHVPGLPGTDFTGSDHPPLKRKQGEFPKTGSHPCVVGPLTRQRRKPVGRTLRENCGATWYLSPMGVVNDKCKSKNQGTLGCAPCPPTIWKIGRPGANPSCDLESWGWFSPGKFGRGIPPFLCVCRLLTSQHFSRIVLN